MRYILFTIALSLTLIVVSCAPEPATEQPEQPPSDIGYPTVADAFTALQARDDVFISVEDGWTIITEPGGLTIWSFAPRGHPAYPAVAKRVLYEDDGTWYIKMDVRCEAGKAACGQLVREFEALNESMRKAIEEH